MSAGGDGGGSNSPSRTISRRPLRACPMLCRRPLGPPSAASPAVQPRAPGSGLVSGYATLTGAASPLHDASTAHGEEAASTLTLLPKQRGREQAGGCQLLRFAAGLTRPDGTSARVLRGSGPVETTHPHDSRTPCPVPQSYHWVARRPIRPGGRAAAPPVSRQATPRRVVPWTPSGDIRRSWPDWTWHHHSPVSVTPPIRPGLDAARGCRRSRKTLLWCSRNNTQRRAVPGSGAGPARRSP